MDVVVSGAGGLIGAALTPALERSGHRVIPLLRGGDEGGLRWDPRQGIIEAAGLEGVDAVVHLAGSPIASSKWTPEQKALILDSRTKGTTLLATTLAGLQNPPQVMVSASAVGYYGNRGDEILTEDSARGSGYLADVVEQWEQAAQPASDAGIRVVHPRTGIVLSPKGGVLHQLLLPFKLGLGGKQGSGKQYMSWISIDDEVGALIALLEDPALSGPVNLTAPNPVTNAEFAQTLGRVLGRPAVLPTPMLPLKIRYGPELVQSLLLDGQRVLPARLQGQGFGFSQPDLEPALRALLDKPGG
ncbi:MAG: hypothetical protein JWL73_1921 [Actinomycetia bacterium]|nr:hypothetical protein [Actinomycetes bacterium]